MLSFSVILLSDDVIISHQDSSFPYQTLNISCNFFTTLDSARGQNFEFRFPQIKYTLFKVLAYQSPSEILLKIKLQFINLKNL